MFREMRRFRQQLPEEESVEILKKNTSGVLSLLGDDGYPYGLPLSHVYHDGNLYFHGSKTGHKIDAMRGCEKASFCVIDKDDVVKEEYTTYFKSVIAFGKIKILEDESQIKDSIRLLGKRYFPEDSDENLNAVIEKSKNAMYMIKLEIEHMTGKEAIELLRMRG